ncbi:MAG: hypothetical protein JJ911_08750 [Rhizobiaceae bacterium]|jgi:surface antigen|nr:hypothetical protein [Rhizobiaceae bacterium]
MKSILTMLAAALILGGCATSGGGNSALVGSFAGSGARDRGVGSGAVGNGLIAAYQGSRLGAGDRRLALEAEYQALEYTQAGQPVSWTGTDGGVTGRVIAYQPYRVGSQDCRQYQHVLLDGGSPQTLLGAACRNEDGSWSLLT